MNIIWNINEYMRISYWFGYPYECISYFIFLSPNKVNPRVSKLRAKKALRFERITHNLDWFSLIELRLSTTPFESNSKSTDSSWRSSTRFKAANNLSISPSGTKQMDVNHYILAKAKWLSSSLIQISMSAQLEILEKKASILHLYLPSLGWGQVMGILIVPSYLRLCCRCCVNFQSFSNCIVRFVTCIGFSWILLHMRLFHCCHMLQSIIAIDVTCVWSSLC